ncbi:MAG: DUF6867 family protein [Alphaproteobacteria bacterium]
MSELLGGPPGAYLGLVVVIMGGAAFLTGQAVAGTWKPAWQLLPYGFLLAVAARFLLFALFQGDLLALPGFAIDVALMIAIAAFAFRVTRVRKMISQYPWLYRRAGLLGYRPREEPPPA